MKKKKKKLFSSLTKSYVYFALTIGIVNSVLLVFVVHPESATIEITLGWLLLALALFVLNVWIYSLWTAKRITTPLEQIAAAIQDMSRGQYQRRLGDQAGFEFSLIQQQFNEMAEKLETATAENLRLENSKQRMLVNLSHDLKTPITTIQGYAKALQLGIVENEEERSKYLELIYNKSILVTSLIEDIFSLSKLDSPDYPLEKTSGDLAELIRELAAETYEQFTDKGLPLNLRLPRRKVTFTFDGKLMRRTISNLLTNALLYNPPGTEVIIQLSETDHEVWLDVIDNGVGIPDELKEVIFDPFVRGDASRRSDGGTGLGLAIAKTTVELHGGRLTLDNSPGNTAFQIVLPKDVDDKDN
ncbi:signal transduction histidine kinase [Fontibacillus phaseoli]|uniref:histidine kinase n=1 Tax=Fontibacillus phaseoli TaxID=1416533 RepID=A0A369B821_9BACL|nr:HAMP domain-containing sensor histidine kinase [Fontibacillus phaseoli]RCX16687.1 signal transduction histidine kinase [Fontibacillus phaseoli]